MENTPYRYLAGYGMTDKQKRDALEEDLQYYQKLLKDIPCKTCGGKAKYLESKIAIIKKKMEEK